MDHDKSFVLKKMSGTNSQRSEEQVGLLNTPTDDELSPSKCKQDRESYWTDKPEPTQNHTPRWRWTKTIPLTLLLACTIVAFSHLALSGSQSDQKSFSTTAKLRSEEDYILDPAWDFDAPTTTREFTWVIEDHELNPDGVYRPMMLINNTFPGPLVECNEGDEIVVHVHNRAVNATSIHWHGLYQNGTNWMDGTVGVTQCPIAPDHSFTYRFNVSGQSGTYWYHSHMSMQVSDGLVGPLIVHAKGGEEKSLQKLPYEQDRVVLLSDHYYDLSSELLMKYLEPGSENDEPVPPSALINGRNVRNCSDLPNRHCSSNGLSNALFDLRTDTSTRMRIINVGAFAEFSMQIDEHEFQVTEVDGTDVLPQSIHRLNINPAQRYSIIVTPPPKDENKGSYWMRARMITHCFAYEEPELQEEVRGVLHYSYDENNRTQKTQIQAPQSRDWPEIIEVECLDLNTSTLEPAAALAAPATADHLVYFRSSFQIRDWRLSRGYLNESSFRVNATSPILNTYLDSPTELQRQTSTPAPNKINTALFDPKHQLIHQTTSTPTIDILIQNLDDGNHPFHLHGYKFWVLAQGHAYPPADLYENLNLTNPVRRDTASVEAFGWSLVRFVADNPGVWAFHCHIGWHTEAGLMMVFATRVEEMDGWRGEVEVENARGLCGAEGVERGMGPDDDIWVGKWNSEGV